MFSSTAAYALRAVIYIAESQSEGPVSGGSIAGALGAPRNYMSKTLHGLVRAGVLDSTRGKRGGFKLSVAPEDLSLLTVVSVFDQLDARRQCLLGRPQCRDEQPCAMHARWKPLAEGFADFLRLTTVADVMDASVPTAV